MAGLLLPLGGHSCSSCVLEMHCTTWLWLLPTGQLFSSLVTYSAQPACLPACCAGWGPLSPMQLAAAVSTTLQLPLLFVDLRRLSRLAMVRGAG